MNVRTPGPWEGLGLLLIAALWPLVSTGASQNQRVLLPRISMAKVTQSQPNPQPTPPPPVPPVVNSIVVKQGDDLRAIASKLQPGQAMLLRGGVYDLGSTRLMLWLTGNSSMPVRMTSYPGERAVLRGLVRLELSYAKVDNITFEWGQGTSFDHMLKLAEGNDWVFEHNEVRGARSYACIQVGANPKRWTIRNNYIHDCLGGNGDENQNHGIYANIPGSEAGLIEGNTIVNTPFGKNIKLGPPDHSIPGPRNVVVRGNTMRTAARSLISLSGVDISNVVIEHNTMSDTSESAVRLVWANGSNSSVILRANTWSNTPAYCLDGDSTLLCSQVIR